MDLNLKDVQKTYEGIFIGFSITDRTKKSKNASGSLSKKKAAKYRRLTIARTMEELLILFPDAQPYEIWKMIEKAHTINFIKQTIKLPEKALDNNELLEFILDYKTLTVMDSAAQSWKRASGVAWEEFLQRSLNLSDPTKEIKILNPPEMNSLLMGKPLVNAEGNSAELLIPSDDVEYLEFINKVLNDKNFDLFLVCYLPTAEKWKLIGLIQCKTSIRDRIKINMKSSLEAMQHHLWSIVIAMDSDSFVSGGGQYNKAAKDFWNGFYILDNNASNDLCIYYGNLEVLQNTIKTHCSKVLSSMLHKTDSIKESWRPSN